MEQQISEAIQEGRTALGIELGSTRIKAVLIDEQFQTIATGSYEWENQLLDGVWTYSLASVWQGIQESYQALAASVQSRYGEPLTRIGSIGFSAMMHGYLAFDENDQLLVPFRTWRNASTEAAEKALTELFQYNIPQRWSIAHLYQAILNQEAHIPEVNFLTTLAGYVHWQLTGEKVIGIGDASGMFPIDSLQKDYDRQMMAQFDDLILPENLPWQLADILPKVLVAGEAAGTLSAAGALRLDPTGTLLPGIPFCPPEGDAGTGMVATNSVAQRSGNVSAGTSAFAMIVLESGLSKVYPEIDLVTTPAGDLVGMVHTNNCTSEINAWVKVFREFVEAAGVEMSTEALFTTLFNQALKGDPDCGGLLSYGYYSGENITKIAAGRPLFVRSPESRFTLANFMRLHLFSAFGAMKIGMDILTKEQVKIDRIVGHGGIFKTPTVAQRVLAAAMEAPVTVMETAGEGGAWGIALLAAFMKKKSLEETLTVFLSRVFQGKEGTTLAPLPEDIVGFTEFVKRYQHGLPIEQAAIDGLI
ncbi:xylulokinase [Enterococcus gallinarum]|uniref:xylulokinase n=1 Tax=Enterococcus gallinarum TaxID=1353 RepID=UPI0004977FB5|nr:FGGY-family carbohydrate kinase [Enterococcus gallinarum]